MLSLKQIIHFEATKKNTKARENLMWTFLTLVYGFLTLFWAFPTLSLTFLTLPGGHCQHLLSDQRAYINTFQAASWRTQI